MATNFAHEDGDDEMMDDEKPSVIEECGQTEPALSSNLAGPMALSICFHYIILSCVNPASNERIDVPLNGILDALSKNSTDCDDDMDELEKLAKQYYLNLYICIINQNEKSFYDLNNSSEQEGQQWARAYLVFDKYNRSFYPFYTRDENHKIHTTFPTNDTHILRLFEELAISYNWPDHSQARQHLPNHNISEIDQHNDNLENASTINANHHEDHVDNQSNHELKTSDFSSLLAQNIQNLIPHVRSQLDSVNCSFKSSDYQLDPNDLASSDASLKTLQVQLQRLLHLVDRTVENLETNPISTANDAPTSMETDDSKIIQNTASDNHQQKMLTTAPIKTKPSLRLNSRSTVLENIDPPPITTNHFHDTIRLPKLKLMNQPTRFRHNREPKTVGKGCPAVQIEGAPQRSSLLFKLPKEIKKYEQEEFFIGSHVKKYDGNEHAQKRICPIPTKIKENHSLKANEQKIPDEYDTTSQGVFSKINLYELKYLQKGIKLLMFNLKQDDDITKNLITEDKLIWCRLMFAIYTKSSDGNFKRVSPVIYSDLIEDTSRSQSLDVKTIFPDSFCERGGQMVFIQLKEFIEKINLHVLCNDKILGENDYQVGKSILSFESPICSPGRITLDVIIYVKNVNEPMTFTRPYHQHHDDHSDPCGVINED